MHSKCLCVKRALRGSRVLLGVYCMASMQLPPVTDVSSTVRNMTLYRMAANQIFPFVSPSSKLWLCLPDFDSPFPWINAFRLGVPGITRFDYVQGKRGFDRGFGRWTFTLRSTNERSSPSHHVSGLCICRRTP
ncbi:hypothetical protein VNO77_27078 [Canavalia gladiata]|uniref:Uncharacterized protein n=1 Tax=Canavalia gladiata TaxID=3824 RepID=A0AAN9Q6T8_CANGL